MDQMSLKQWKLLDVVKRIEGGLLTVGQAAEIVGLSKRQMRRVRGAVAERGKAGVVHGNQGRAPSNRVGAKTRRRVETLFRSKYVGFNDQQFTEELVGEGIEMGKSTVRRILRDAKLPASRQRRATKHRARRDRRPQAGLMILWDGSSHAWLEARGPKLCLMAAIDDATGELLPGAHFVEQECAAGYLRVLRDIARSKGLPCSIYMDKHGSLRRNDAHWTLEEELRGRQDPTHVGSAIEALAIEAIYAHSPQAKGRVERLWGTLQDRLVSTLRLCGTCTQADANAVLEHERAEFNERFAIAAVDERPAWRLVPRSIDLDRVCGFRYPATVQNDNTVRIGGRVFDIPPGPGQRSYAHARVELNQLLDGTWRIYDKTNRIVATAPAAEVGELRAKASRKRSAASRAFRKALTDIAVSLP